VGLEPLGIVDDDEDRPLRRTIAEHAQARQRNQEEVRRPLVVAEAKSDTDGIALTGREVIDERHHRPLDRVHAGERQAYLRRCTRGAEHVHTAIRRQVRRPLDQCRPADARFAADQQRGAVVFDIREQSVDRFEFLGED
jgi:hypothetical protein